MLFPPFGRLPHSDNIWATIRFATRPRRSLATRQCRASLHLAIPGPSAAHAGGGTIAAGGTMGTACRGQYGAGVLFPPHASGGRCPGGGRCPARPQRNIRPATRGCRAEGRGHQRRYSWLPSAGVRACMILPPSRVGRCGGHPSSFFTGLVRDPKITPPPLRLTDDAGLRLLPLPRGHHANVRRRGRHARVCKPCGAGKSRVRAADARRAGGPPATRPASCRIPEFSGGQSCGAGI